MSAPNPKEDGLRGFMSSTGIPLEWIRRLLDANADATRIRHESITPSEYGARAPGSQPAPVPVGTVFTLEFTPNNDSAYRVFKVPTYFVGEASFHMHWTKSADVDESGRAVKWRVSYNVFDGGPQAGGTGGDIITAPTVLEFEDVYEDNDASGTRLIYRTPNLVSPGFIAGHYVGVCIEAITPTGLALLNDPALVSMDLIWSEYINK